MSKIFFILTLMFFSCNTKTEKSEENPPSSKPPDDGIVLKKFNSLSVTGDFDGDKKLDTITQHIGSKYKKGDFDSIVDPLKNHWDVVTNWHFNRGTDLYITITKSETETLHLGSSQGLYCLINIGDNNADGKDEIAFVIDNLDFSRVNSCKVYSLCKDKWTELKQFGIHEDSFNFTTDTIPTFDNIKDYLEKQNGKWVYMDYSQNEFDKAEDVGKMRILKLDKCK